VDAGCITVKCDGLEALKNIFARIADSDFDIVSAI
jgi:hypothetical protein